MAAMNGKDCVLIVCTDAFHQGWMGATRRIFHLAMSFRQLGFQAVLLAGRATNPKVQHKIDTSFPGIVIRTGHTGDYPRLIDTHPLSRRVWRAGWKLRGKSYYWRKLSWGWADRLALPWLEDVLRKHDLRPVLIWGICVGYLDGAVLADRFAGQWGLPWIFELQDPPYRAGLGPDTDGVVACFKRLLENTSRSVVVAGSYGRDVSERFGYREKLHTVYLSYDGEPSAVKDEGGAVFSLVYAGSLNGGRSILPVLAALACAIREQPEMGKTFKMHLAGSGTGYDEGRAFAEANHLSGLLHFEGILGPDAVERLIGAGDALLIVQPETAAKQVPGKIFESMKACRPIIGVMPTDCEAAGILGTSGLGIVHDERDIDGLRETLLLLWEGWRSGTSPVVPDDAFIRGFSVSNLPDKIARVIEDVANIPGKPVWGWDGGEMNPHE